MLRAHDAADDGHVLGFPRASAFHVTVSASAACRRCESEETVLLRPAKQVASNVSGGATAGVANAADGTVRPAAGFTSAANGWGGHGILVTGQYWPMQKLLFR